MSWTGSFHSDTRDIYIHCNKISPDSISPLKKVEIKSKLRVRFVTAHAHLSVFLFLKYMKQSVSSLYHNLSCDKNSSDVMSRNRNNVNVSHSTIKICWLPILFFFRFTLLSLVSMRHCSPKPHEVCLMYGTPLKNKQLVISRYLFVLFCFVLISVAVRERFTW